MQQATNNLLDTRAASVVMLLQMQDSNNMLQHHPDWAEFGTPERPDHRMALLELAEVWDHMPSGQWWKRGGTLEQFLNEKEREQAALEIVDAIHFALSHAIRNHHFWFGTGKPPTAGFQELSRAIAEASLDASVMHEKFLCIPDFTDEVSLTEFNGLIDTAIMNVNFSTANNPPTPYCLDKSQLAPKGETPFDFFWTSVFRALYILDYSFDEVVALYVAKNVLNGFRVRNGYTKKAGLDRYIKRAADGPEFLAPEEGDSPYAAQEDVPARTVREIVEDNYHLPAIAAKVTKLPGVVATDFPALIEEELTELYRGRWIKVLQRANAVASAEAKGHAVACSNEDAESSRFVEPAGGWYPRLLVLKAIVEGDADEFKVVFESEDGATGIEYAGYHPGFHRPAGSEGNETSK